MDKEISIKPYPGEIGSPTTYKHVTGGITYDAEDWGEEHLWYEVNATLIQEKTSTELNVTKEFEDLKSAKNFAEKFIKENPTSEIVIKKLTEKEVFYYV